MTISREKLLRVAEVTFEGTQWRNHMKISYMGEVVSSDVPRNAAAIIETTNVLIDKLLPLIAERLRKVSA